MERFNIVFYVVWKETTSVDNLTTQNVGHPQTSFGPLQGIPLHPPLPIVPTTYCVLQFSAVFGQYRHQPGADYITNK